MYLRRCLTAESTRVMGTYNLTHALLRITMPVEVRSHAQNGASKIQKTGVTVRQLSRLTGINRGIVQRAQNVSDYTSP
jgi:hypothetical protein